jgi:diguanylate cyclase (GGDEF)-like protein
MNDNELTKEQLLNEVWELRRKVAALEENENELNNTLNKLRGNEVKYKSIFNNMLNGFAYHKIIVDKNNNPIDYVFLEVNPVFEKFTGLKQEDIIGEKVTKIIPGIKDAKPDLIRMYGNVALKGTSYKFDLYFEPFNKWYTVSSYSPEESYFVTIFQDISDRKKLEEELRTLSLTDELTGLYNRRGFFTLANQQMKVANRKKGGLLLLFADVDGLKLINDRFGHKGGDLLLINTANLLKEVFRESDIIARMGGDEFVVFSIEPSDRNIDTLKNRFEKHVADYNAKRTHTYKLSLSVGILHYKKECLLPLNELLIQADTLMLEQKKKKKKTE